ncbi:MAG: CPBP family intramembrane metalloprotease [Lachnospiraceae bacterium]|nr:CPBP family intramembrane metalloprotease [Lachnospiraceae bacterium]
MNYRQLGTLYKKEILDVIRDKKTILTMVVLPVLLYPLLFLVIMQIMTLVMEEQETSTYYIAYDNVSEEHREALNDWISGDADELDYILEEVESKDVKADLEAEEIDVYITVNETESQLTYEIHYMYANTSSNTAAGMLKEEIESYSAKVAEDNAREQGLDVDKLLYPVVATMDDQSSNESSMGSMLGGIIPFLLITSIVMGCIYPAIDATAGEKERGTLETLLTLPVGNLELIASKFLSVATIAVVSVLMNVLSMGIVVVYLYSTMTALSDGASELEIGTFIPAILITVVCVVAFSLFISAITMIVCAFAKSFKEANNYVTPISLVVMLTGYVGIIPTIELTSTTALVPVVNICLLIKNLLVFKYDFTLIVLVLLSNIIYAFISVWVLAKIYNSENILFGESLSGIKLFEKRSNIKKGSLPSVQESLLILVVALLLMVYVGGIVSTSVSLPVGLVVQQAFIGVLPILAAIYIKADMKTTFALKLPTVKALFGTIILGVGAICFNLLASSLLSMVFPSDSEALDEGYMQLLDGVSFVPGLLLMALLPAVCEEILFRGYMFTAFRNRLSLPKAIVIVSILFGISHMSMIKLLPTAILGVALAYMIYKSGSILCSSLIHFLNNGFAVWVLFYGSEITFLNDDTMTVPVMVGMAVIALICIPIGVALLGGRKEKKIEEETL